MCAAVCCALSAARISLPTYESWLVALDICQTGRFNRVLSVRQGFFLCSRNAMLLVQVNQRPPPLLPRALFGARTTRPLIGLIWPKDGWHLDRLSRNGGGATFFPWPSAIPRGSQESPAAAILRCAPASKLVRRRSPPACRSPSRPRWSRARNSQGEVTWPTSVPSRSPAASSRARS
jgi:hypothetical protein